MTSAVAVGVFDGLHLGHREIIGSAVARAREFGGTSVVVSFDPHPDVVLSKPFHAVAPLTPHTERRARLLEMGVDRYEVIPFTRELAALEPEVFCERHLIEPFGMRELVVGENFALGRGRSGNVERLRAIGAERGFSVQAVRLLDLDGAPVTSTRIRGLLAEGRVGEAARLLGRRYGFRGTVVSGDRIGRTLGCPTANLRLHAEQQLPRNGIYAAWARIPGETSRRAAAMSIGVRPTIDGQSMRLEVHVIDWTGELLGQELDVELEDWLRPELKFEGLEALAAAIQDDLKAIRARLGRLAEAD